MSPRVRIRHRLNVVLQMVTGLIVATLLGQLWLFTVTLDAMENGAVPPTVAGVAAACSVFACGSIWMLIRLFLRVEQAETADMR